MSEQELKNTIKTAFTRAVPDVLDTVNVPCSEGINPVPFINEPKRKQSVWHRFSALAAALVLILGLSAGAYYGMSRAVAATVSLDVNPSIEIKVNKHEKVLAVNALNEDAKTVVGTMDFEGSSLEVAVNALIGSMLRNGYLNELANSILVSVDDRDAQRAELLKQRLTVEINALLHTDTFEGSVLSQTITADSHLQEIATQYGITVGKTRLIEQIVAQNPRYSFEELVSLSINELNLISESGSLPLEQITTTGSPSVKAYVHPDKAQMAALLYAKIDAVEVLHMEYELDYDDGCIIYELEFYTKDRKYDCHVNAITGQVLKCQAEYPSYDDHDDHHDNHHSGTSAPTPAPSPSTTITAIGINKAKRVALDHAEVAEADIIDWDWGLDWDFDLRVYEIEFKAGGFAYSYEIHAYTGAILKAEKESID